ncbi:hypothetical protein BDQ17DRAFT_1400949 [Cyathus striatus]|nr:hypothetical protein BDQ17DRAFT_1400949 [Cyathus striatus]
MDGSRLRQSWYTSLNDAEAHFRHLLTSPSTDWKRLSVPDSASKKGKARAPFVPELADVIVHRSTASGDDIYRIVLDIPTADELVSLEPWKAVLTTPELRQEWDPAVEDAHLVEMFDRSARIAKTNFSLGWPVNPRDAVTISRTFHDTTTLIDISTSLPRSPDEPAYLRPSPPFVRSHIKLFAWCIQHIQPQPPSPTTPEDKKKGGKIRITLMGFGSSTSALVQQLSTMIVSLFKTVMKRGGRVPKLAGYGNGVSIDRIRYQIDREALTVDYSIIPEDEDHSAVMEGHGMDEVQALRECRRLTRSLECVSLKASSEEVENLPWTAQASEIMLRLTHAQLTDEHSVLKVKLVIEASGGTRGLRLNGIPKSIQDTEDRDPSSYTIPQPILQDIASTAERSFQTTETMATTSSGASVSSGVERSPAAEKTILSRVKRNYIYFSSLLQEPEAKWRRTTEGRGVSITQLDSIDPTLVVYRAEATFVGVGLWDLYGAVVSPGARAYWDRQHEDAVLLEDVSELTELWHFRTKPAWPVNGRDAVVLKTVYKSPTTIHVFAFSADDPHLFPNIPPVDPNIIRTQVDLQGWAIEALSPTTTLLTLLEQSDPKGWTNKTSIPTQMINTLAGIGEFAIKCGGPPIVTRLAGGKANEMRYDHDRGSFRVEYEPSAIRRAALTNKEKDSGDDGGGLPVIECEVRCDIDTWASSLDIVVDPPPQTISCLRRHRLSAEGGGLWLTLTHDALFVDDERLQAIVRRAPGKEKGLVMVNGAKIQVDVEELPEGEIKLLKQQKRVKPPRIPLDQPPVVGAVKKRRAEWSASEERGNGEEVSSGTSAVNTIAAWASAPKMSSPLARFFTYAVDQATTTTQQAVAAMTPASSVGSVPSASKSPMQYALEALSWTQDFHASSSAEGWVLVSDKGLPVHRKLAPEISPVIPVHKGVKVIEGVSAEEIAAVVVEPDCRRKWDDRFDSSAVFESYGSGCSTSFLVAKGGFPFRDRGFYLADVVARANAPAPVSRRNTVAGDVAEQSNGSRNAIFCVSASFSPDSVVAFAPEKYNSYALPIGRVYLDAWILETLDPYTKENYAIPSRVESYIKAISPLPITRLPAPALVIAKKKLDEHLASYAWKLRRRDEQRVLLGTRCEVESGVYEVGIVVCMGVKEMEGRDARSPAPAGKRMRISPSPPLEEVEVGSDILDGSPSLTSSTTTITPTSPRPARQRAASSSYSPEVSRNGIPSTPTGSLRGRASTSAFNLKGEVKPPTDLVVAEVVVDSKMYPDGYTVSLNTRTREGDGKYISLSMSTEGTTLPLSPTLYTLPSSPLHSSGLSSESPTRHLLRLTLPTAQYQISTVRDPLTGEVRTAPPRPKWMETLEGDGWILNLRVAPREKSTEMQNKDVVEVNGVSVPVTTEKEGLTTLGREELLDDRVGKASVLSRAPNEAEPLPSELTAPLGIATALVDPSALRPQVVVSENAPETRSEEVPVVVEEKDDGDVPLSTLVVVALIAFLIGSLLRSLISPADFVYVDRGGGSMEGGSGWREMRRLLEVKYIVGGWDFQVAVVRRM